MYNVISLSIFLEKPRKFKKLEFSDKEIEELNKKKIVKIEPVN